MKRASLTCILALVTALPALSHDLYLMPSRFVVQPGTTLDFTFQNGDDFPEASSPVKPERLRDTRLLFRSGTVPFENITAEAKRTTAQVPIKSAGISILTARTIPNFIELEAAQFRAYLEHENLPEALVWREQHNETQKPGRERYSKYVKSMISVGATDDFYRRTTGLTIEIIPEANPYSVKPGGVIPVQVLFRGAPAVNIAVESAWLEGGKAQVRTIGRTDNSGRIRIPIKAAGPHRLHAIVMERCSEPAAADWESFWASLTFEIQAGR